VLGAERHLGRMQVVLVFYMVQNLRWSRVLGNLKLDCGFGIEVSGSKKLPA
jgi:hypothetical protein